MIQKEIINTGKLTKEWAAKPLKTYSKISSSGTGYYAYFVFASFGEASSALASINNTHKSVADKWRGRLPHINSTMENKSQFFFRIHESFWKELNIVASSSEKSPRELFSGRVLDESSYLNPVQGHSFLFMALKEVTDEKIDYIKKTIEEDPARVNAVITKGSYGSPFLHSILYAAASQKRDTQEKDSALEETTLLSLADYVLAQKVCDVSSKNSNGDTPLHLAILFGYPQIAESIIKKATQDGCLFTMSKIRNENGKSCSDLLVKALEDPALPSDTKEVFKEIHLLLEPGQNQVSWNPVLTQISPRIEGDAPWVRGTGESIGIPDESLYSHHKII